ncbi:MAG: glutamate--cysteine ligase [Gammaproteobacteria bacterium]|nr:MAG: glutamate--cysteine ligase [Gammaproteobacteria bacterium]
MSVENLYAVPNLTTVLTGPLREIEQHLLNQQSAIETWFRNEWRKTPAPFYASVDLRNAGFKLAPVDTNLFPAGFNNLNPAFMPLCIQATQSALEHICPGANRVLIIPENHTRNTAYFESLAMLQEVLNKAGYATKIGSLDAELESAQTQQLPSGDQLTLHPIVRNGNRISVDGFDPCIVLLNNDLSSGAPAVLENIEQTVIPPIRSGWAHRLKSGHFGHYQQVAEAFAEQIGIDPWLINPLFTTCGEINFMKREGEDCIAHNVGKLLDAIQKKYDEYGITEPPFIIVKADAGTYGMGIMTIHSIEEARELNRKQRTKMSKIKGGQAVSKVILQEGVYTFESWGSEQAVAEPVVYMLDHFVVGGFYRVHTGRSRTENLNAPGMHFEPLAFAEPCNSPNEKMPPDACPNRFYAYGVIARLALLAAARELDDLKHSDVTKESID